MYTCVTRFFCSKVSFFVDGFTEVTVRTSTMTEDSKEELELVTDEGGQPDEPEPDPLLDEILLDVDNLVQERTLSRNGILSMEIFTI
jgi:hypothetical protein